jgi:phosphoribosylformylglycinamidine synthase subunit PurSL
VAHRIEIIPTVADARAQVRKRQLESMGFADKIRDVQLVDVYTVDAHLREEDLPKIGSMLADTVTEQVSIDASQAPEQFDWAVEIGYHPGVTDNVAATARESLEDLLKTRLQEHEGVYSSQMMFLSGALSHDDVQTIAGSLSNSLIQRTHIKSFDQFRAEHGMNVVVPKVMLAAYPTVDTVDLLGATDEALAVLGKKGIANCDGSAQKSKSFSERMPTNFPSALSIGNV